MPLKYTNKRKNKGYWKIYERARGEVPLLTNKTLYHSNIDRWFQKLDEEYVYKAARKCRFTSRKNALC